MKNIEKYTNTKDALEAYNSRDFKNIPFNIWLEREYEEPRVHTLLEAATEVREPWNAKIPYGALSRVATKISVLSDAIEREKRKPLRNCDIGTPEEQSARFDAHCRKHMGCITCPLREKDGGVPKHCEFAWSHMPYEKGETK